MTITAAYLPYLSGAKDLEVAWSGEPHGFIDVTVHDDTRPEDDTTIIASIGLTLEEAKRFAADLSAEIAKCEKS